MGLSIRDEYDTRSGRQRLTLWSGSFCSDYEGEAVELPKHDGYMVDVYGKKFRVHCASPRTEENYKEVDAAITNACKGIT